MIAAVPSKSSLLVVRLGAMGDVIHTLHAVTAIRRAFPDVRIGWVVEERWAELLCAKNTPQSGPPNATRPIVDFVHPVDTKGWRRSLLSPKTWSGISSARREIRGEKYEVIADFQGSLKSAAIARGAGSEMIFGMEKPREAAARLFYKHRIPTKGMHVVEQYDSMSEAIAERCVLARNAIPVGVLEKPPADSRSHPASPSRDLKYSITPVPFPHDAEAENKITTILGGTGNIVLITPGAGWGAKQWPADRYGKVARALADDGMTPIINFGPREEQLAAEAVSASDGAARPISCSIGELIALTRRARLFIGGDTGPLHLAAALRIPVVAIFGPTDPARNGPYETSGIVLRDPASRTSLSHTSNLDPGLLNTTPDQVLSAARRLLEMPVA